MSHARWFRRFGLAAIALNASFSLVAQAGDPEAIEQKLFAQFKPTVIAADRSEIVTTGDRVVIQKPGLTMYDVASPMAPLYTYKNGKIGRGLTGFGKDLQISIKTPGGTAADYARRTFDAGEKCWVTGVQVEKDGVLFRLYSDAYEQTHYYANLKVAFPNKKEIPAVNDALQLVAEVLTVAPAEIKVEKRTPEASGAAAICPAPANQVPAAVNQPAGVSGRYNYDEGDSQLNFVTSTGCIMVGPGGTETAGKYKVSGNTLTMDCTVTGSSFELKIDGDKLIAEDGHAWIRQAATVQLAPSVSTGQTRAQVTAALGPPVKVSRLGAKEIYYYKDMKVTFTSGKVTSVE